jgi:hypothetical protein
MKSHEHIQTFKIPKELKMLGHKVKVTYPYDYKERTDLMGQWDGDLLEIRLNAYTAGGVKRSLSVVHVTLIEEILHGIDEMSGHKIFTTDAGHKALNGIAEGVYQLFIDNFIKEEEEE